jgi:hypothetical protein
MAQTEKAREGGSLTADVDSLVVRRALEEILQSPPFRNSKQCQDMLRYVVEQSLRREQESLRERVIGIEVFGRRHDYDTSDDPVVRIRAADIRKRLAQYYQSAENHDASVRIEIPSGSYRANFEITPQESIATTARPEFDQVSISLNPVKNHLASAVLPVAEPAQKTPGTNLRKRAIWAGSALAVIMLAGWLTYRNPHTAQQSTLDMFWAPVINNPGPVMMYGGANALYRLSKNYLETYQKAHPQEAHGQGQEFFPNFQPGEKIDARELIPVTNTTSDALAISHIVSLLTSNRRSFELRYGSDIAASDIHDSPTILIGGFNNTWTLNMTNPLRFVLKDGIRIEDSWGKTKGWSEVKLPNGDITEDYAVISRLFDPPTGRVLITVAGIGSYGTEKAADFLTNPRELAELEQSAPAGWQKRNMQFVLRVKLQNGVVESAGIVATQCW